ncbi:Domain of unknown function DUF4604 domain-containing protein [Strongyloides ratti]|uniref:DUF4604 domain-containing protein n=1 Tax=Strongyloides ratti TaxID=34506 RepID=A0A090LD68_STRRB|nr:Domain of unknown function DUF4604 domain-containing protein [Strongyloides ratti]CEF66088.1 Domain of unknown function DUF4604 domain-containing protein [Strongyloides ratti]
MSKELPSLNYQQRQNLKFIKQEDPPFIQEMMKKVGYQEVTINDKFYNKDNYEEIKEDEKDDFKPQVVVLDKTKHLTQEEVDIELLKQKEAEDKKSIEEGKIIFRKKKKINEEGSKKEKIKKNDSDDEEPKKKKGKSVNTNLLSFFNDEEEY